MKHWSTAICCFLLFTACSESDINIPSKQNIALSKSFIAIYTPENGSILPREEPFIIHYDVIKGIKTGYVKVQIDNTKPITVYKIKGKHRVKALPVGPHIIRISEYRENGDPTGNESLIKIIIQ